MTQLPRNTFEMDMTASSIEQNCRRLSEHKDDTRVFFVVFCPDSRIFTKEYDAAQTHGFNAVFFVSKADLPNPSAWDIAMYSCKTGEALARIENRPTY